MAWLPDAIGAVILALGLITLLRQSIAHRGGHGIDKIVALAPVAIAVPLGVFGGEHFAIASSIARFVPAWIPGHLFWTYFVGACLVATALSLAVDRYAKLAATLAGVMFVLFVVLIHIPNVVRAPGNRILWAVAVRDLAFAAGAFCLARTVVPPARMVIGIAIVFFGVEQLLNPAFAPGVPLAKLTPEWFPGHLFWGDPTGLVFVVTGICLLINRYAHPAAAWLGVMVLFLVLVIYVPLFASNPSSLENLNYLADTLLLGGAVLALTFATGENFVDSRSEKFRYAR